MSRRKSTKRQRAQQTLAWALYVTEGHAANLGAIPLGHLDPSHAAAVRRAMEDSRRHAQSLRLVLHELNREVYL